MDSGVTAYKQIMRTLSDFMRLLIGKEFELVVLALIGSMYDRYARCSYIGYQNNLNIAVFIILMN